MSSRSCRLSAMFERLTFAAAPSFAHESVVKLPSVVRQFPCVRAGLQDLHLTLQSARVSRPDEPMPDTSQSSQPVSAAVRSEERRVGKESGGRGGRQRKTEESSKYRVR